MVKKNTIELNFYNLFHAMKIHGKFIFLPPAILTLVIFVFLSTRPAVWEARAAIRVGAVSPAGVGLIDLSALEKVYKEWRDSLKDDPSIDDLSIVTRAQEGFLVEVRAVSLKQDSAVKAVEKLYADLQKEQLSQLAFSLKDFNMYLANDEKNLKELKLSLHDNESLLRKYGQGQVEFITLNHLIQLQKEKESQLVDKVARDRSSLDSNVKIKTYFQENITLKPFSGSPNKNLILLLTLFLSFITTTTLVLCKEFLDKNE
ncbi:hypothetical protein DOM21_17620 [Bacteriovorax stolpii]|uniref:chromate transporter n=1 Tax=Bacteriovorax stolpii TaxID=960 RepID=UPI00115828D8|nr:chromate transporter [Bacteriovorax stolpii]QDK43242.1 hypothetical protein DOM21_17620 [Bacteriovorax stolpii]